jgi:hypothetical protein
MKKWIILSLLIAGAIGVSLNSCRNSPFIPVTPQVSFSKDVYPIIIGNCTEIGCHTSNGQHGGEGFSFSNYNDVMSYGQISPGNANKSRLYNALIGNGESLMPKQGELPDNDILTIYLWIEQGAQNN